MAPSIKSPPARSYRYSGRGKSRSCQRAPRSSTVRAVNSPAKSRICRARRVAVGSGAPAASGAGVRAPRAAGNHSCSESFRRGKSRNGPRGHETHARHATVTFRDSEKIPPSATRRPSKVHTNIADLAVRPRGVGPPVDRLRIENGLLRPCRVDESPTASPRPGAAPGNLASVFAVAGSTAARATPASSATVMSAGR